MFSFLMFDFFCDHNPHTLLILFSWNPPSHEHCVQQNMTWECMLASVNAPYVEAPLLHIQSLYDPEYLRVTGGITEDNMDAPRAITLADSMAAAMADQLSALSMSTSHSVFAPACYTHANSISNEVKTKKG